jgi:hypothetical protein
MAGVQPLHRFREVAVQIGQAKDRLLAAVPAGRGPGAPVAEAVASFEEHLRAVRASLDEWPPAMEAERGQMKSVVDESLRRAEALRLTASPAGYEELYALLGEILDPLDGVEEVGRRLRRASR